MANAGVVIVYDGDCFFCANVAKLTRLREHFGDVRLVNARDADDPLVADLRRRYRLNDGFVIIHDGREYYGPEAMSFLALTAERGRMGRLLGIIVKAPGGARLLYPVFVRLRKMTLRWRGRSELSY